MGMATTLLFHLLEGLFCTLVRALCAIACQGQGGEEVPVQVIVDVEIAGEAGSSVLGLVPGVASLLLQQKADAPAAGRMVAESSLLQGDHGPGRLRWAADADAGERWILIGPAGLAPSAVRVLHLQ